MWQRSSLTDGRCAPCGAGIIFNTRVVEGCRSQFGVPPNSVGIIFNTCVAEGVFMT